MSSVKKDPAGDADSDTSGGSAVTVPGKDPAVQGEGDYQAARRHRRKVRDFIATSDTEELAREAAPRSEAEHQQMLEAERQGLARAKGKTPAPPGEK